MPRRYSNTELLAEIHRLAEIKGEPPTIADLRDRGEHAPTTYYDRFGSWQAALQAAGYRSRDPQSKIPKDELIDELHQLAVDLDDPPSAVDMNEQGEYWASTYQDRFGSWNEAIEAAGLEPTAPDTSIPPSKLIAEIQRLADELGDPPTFREMNEQGGYSGRTYIRQFGSWNEAIEAAGYEPQNTQSEVTDSELIEEIHRLTVEFDEPPSVRDMRERGEFSPATYQRHFGSWSEAIETALSEDNSN